MPDVPPLHVETCVRQMLEQHFGDIVLCHNFSASAVGSLVVRASDSRPEGLGSMLDVTKYPPSAHGFTCRNCGGGDRGRVAIYRPFGEVSLSLNRTVTCMVLKANDRRTSCPCHDEFRGPRSDYVRQVALATTTNTYQLAQEKSVCCHSKCSKFFRSNLNCEISIILNHMDLEFKP
ncbi:uncharacterized protein TNCV_4276601 [Trichonephila clavipes]|nr:uncharacterized protein TNCV_4276601 [Trichonephila clavipes]